MNTTSNMTKLLLVDDNPQIRESFASLFSSKGYTVSVAGSVEEALDLARNDLALSFVLLDHVLDGTPESGMIAATKISSIRPDIFIVMYTADPYINNELRWKAMAAGAHRYIRKANANELLRDINDFLRDFRDLKEITYQFERIAAGTLEMTSALVGMDIGITLIDKEYRVWYANKAQTDIVGVANIVGAPCWVKLKGYPVEYGPCVNCSAKEVFNSKVTITRAYLSRFPSGKLGWIQVQTSPVFSEGDGNSRRVIGARMATQKLHDTMVHQMDLEERLHIIARGIVFSGYGRARIYRTVGNERLQVITAATGSDRNNDMTYRNKIKDLLFPLENSYIKKAIKEVRGTLNVDWDLSIGRDLEAIMQLDLSPPWIDLPIWNEGYLIGWLSVDLAYGNKSSLSDIDVEALWSFSEEIRRAFTEEKDVIKDIDPLLREIADARLAIVGAQNADEALNIILGILSKIRPCSSSTCPDIEIRIREDGNLVELKHFKSNDNSFVDIIRETDAGSLTAYVVRSGNAIYIDNFEEYQRRIAEGDRLPLDKTPPSGSSLAILPLKIELNCFGTLRIEPYGSVNWDAPGLKALLAEFASLTALIVRDIVINQKLAKAKAVAEKEVELAFGAIHGVKGPVQVVRNYIELIPTLQQQGRLTLENAVEYAKSAGQALARVERLTGRLLRIVRPRKGRLRSEDTGILLNECVADNRLYYPEMIFELDVSSEALGIQVDPEEFRSVLNELITNSARATNNKGKVDISARIDGRYIVISLEDNGPGVSPNDLERIFELWYSNFSGGSGLGLSFVRKVLEDMNGAAHAEAGRSGLKIVLQIPRDTWQQSDVDAFREGGE